MEPTDFAGGVVVADVVEVRLRQRSMDEAEDQQADPQSTHPALLSPTAKNHAIAPCPMFPIIRLSTPEAVSSR